MGRGRKPEPSALRQLRGNPGKRPLPVGEPKPSGALPKPPVHLTHEGLAEWERVCGELHRIGVVTCVDRAVLGAYCTVYQRWIDAESHIDDLICQTPNGFYSPNPYIAIANKALELMYKYMQDLGLTPSSRVKLATGQPTEGDMLDQFITAGKRKGTAA